MNADDEQVVVVGEKLPRGVGDRADRDQRRIGVGVARQLERADLEWADLVVRVGCGEMCPVIPGRRYLDWNVQDPNETDPETTRRIRDEIARRVGALLYEYQGSSEA